MFAPLVPVLPLLMQLEYLFCSEWQMELSQKRSLPLPPETDLSALFSQVGNENIEDHKELLKCKAVCLGTSIHN